MPPSVATLYSSASQLLALFIYFKLLNLLTLFPQPYILEDAVTY